MTMRILVTGAFGFIGTALVHQLHLAGHEVTALTSQPPDKELPDLPVAKVVYGSMLDAEALRAAVRGAEGIVHLAALTRVRESFDREIEYLDVNAGGTAELIQAAQREARAGGLTMRIVFTSTGAVYDTDSPQPFTESSALRPTNPYALSKLRAEETLGAAARTSPELSVAIMRAFNVAGAAHGRRDGDLSRIIPKTLAVAAGHAPSLQVNGDGSALRDFVHVSDAARALIAALQAEPTGSPRIFNVGATPASVSDIIEVCRKVTGRTITLENLPPKPEPQALLADCALIRRELHWAPLQSDIATIVSDAWAATSACR